MAHLTFPAKVAVMIVFFVSFIGGAIHFPRAEHILLSTVWVMLLPSIVGAVVFAIFTALATKLWTKFLITSNCWPDLFSHLLGVQTPCDFWRYLSALCLAAGCGISASAVFVGILALLVGFGLVLVGYGGDVGARLGAPNYSGLN